MPWSFGVDLDNYNNAVNWTYNQNNDKSYYLYLDSHPYGHNNPNAWSNRSYIVQVRGSVKDLSQTSSFTTKSDYYFRRYTNQNYSNQSFWQTWIAFYDPTSGGEEKNYFANRKNRIDFTKLGEQEKDQGLEMLPLQGASFLLYKDGDLYVNPSGQLDALRESGPDGSFFWEALPPGSYRLHEQESEATQGYILAEDRTFTVNPDGTITEPEEGTVIENKKKDLVFYIKKFGVFDGRPSPIGESKMQLEFTAPEGTSFPEGFGEQTWEDSDLPPDKGYIRKKVSQDRTKIVIELDLAKGKKVERADGTIIDRGVETHVPANWPKGDYKVKEVDPPAGYKLWQGSYTFELDPETSSYVLVPVDEPYTVYMDPEKGLITLKSLEDGVSSATFNPDDRTLAVYDPPNEFPYTGGLGPWTYGLIGLALMALALIKLRKERRWVPWQ